MNLLPQSRTKDIVVQHLGKEFLVYDLTTHKAFHLNETSSIVFNACDGVTSFDDLRVKSRLTDDVIYLALDGLRKENLLGGEYVSPFAGMSRREVVKKVGLASMIALPLISSLVVPTAASAASAPTSDCPSRGGTCIAAGGNLCTGRANQTVTFYYYNTGNGTCQGASFASNPDFPCGNTAPSSQQFDVCRVG